MERATSQVTLGDVDVPAIVREMASGRPIELAWRNDLGGLTFRIDETFVKWNPPETGVDLERERRRLEWLAGRHPAPHVLGHGSDASSQWLITAAIPGECAVGVRWRERSHEAIRAIAAGLRAIHAIPVAEFPPEWTSESWVDRTPETLGARPTIVDAVLVHGDACAPNTLISPDGQWTGNVDFGDLAVGDRWADLAVASMSLDWNFGDGHQDELFAAYGIDRDEQRIDYYRRLWDLES